VALVKPAKRLEKSIEASACRELRKCNAKVVKLNIMGQRSWPDRLAIAPNGAHCYIEFKRPDEDPTPLQADLHADLAKRGIKVHVAHSEQEALLAYAKEKARWQDVLDTLKERRSSSFAHTRKKR
jgi:hypothetical protein